MRTPPDPESTPPAKEPTLKLPSTRYQRQALTQLGIDMSERRSETELAGVPPRCRVASLTRTNIGELVLSDVVLDERHAHGASTDDEVTGLDGLHTG